MHEELRQAVCAANLQLHQHKLVIYSWGNVSGIDRRAGVVAIKPSGVAYEQLTPEAIVVLDLAGRVVAGDLRPSSDTPTHLELYRAFDAIGGICHTHSRHATMWAQACRAIPCLGTTHADYFYGEVPVTDPLAQSEIEGEYEKQTGRVIIRRFANLDPRRMPAVLVANHGPFTWGATPAQAVESSVILEEAAALALGTLTISPYQSAINQNLLDKHYLRKHGNDAYYGQKTIKQ
ncbi:MAG: L-ribulose-5-phosphate 4-epimerase [Sedimentisphaerales bacterium]|nr:L-ribulose-5-phosphate 4-epimerase [Sedimentisphaerales bacterium]